MAKTMQRNARSNKGKLIWDLEDDFLEHDRASPLMLGADKVGRVVPRVQGGCQVVFNRGVVLDRKSTDYRIHPGDGVTYGLWFDLPRDVSPRG